MSPRIDSYEWSGVREAMLRWGPANGSIVIAALPLLEEANRTRALVVTVLRALAERGIGGVLPDLPGTGESLVPTARMRLADLRAGYAAATRASGARYSLAVRSGALLDDEAELAGRWHLASQSGEDVLREWQRVAGGEVAGEQVEVAGNVLSREFLDALSAPALPGESRGPEGSSGLDPGVRRGKAKARVVRLTSDPRDADLKVDGPPLWRRSEPGNDPALAQRLADDIADWIATCGG